jgi:hypothetical protein
MRFRYSDTNFDVPPPGVYLTQIVKAEKGVSKMSGSDMVTVNLRTLPDGYALKYFLVGDGLITQFCRHCEGELAFPADPKDEFSLTPSDVLHRIAFAEVVHEETGGQPRAKVKFGGILSRAAALARNAGLANIKLPANVPPPKSLPIMPAEEKGPAASLPDDSDDSMPF